MALSSADITKLAARKGVRKIAVENFLSTLGSEGPYGRSGALRNLWSDAKDYKWNSATVSAITSGINKYFAAS